MTTFALDALREHTQLKDPLEKRCVIQEDLVTKAILICTTLNVMLMVNEL